MKKLLLASMLSAMCIAPAFAQSEMGYLTDNSGKVVKSGHGLCWNTSATKVHNPECGDVIEQPKKAEVVLPAPALVPAQVITVSEVKKEVSRQKVVINSDILFKFDSSVLSQAGENALMSEVVAVNPLAVEVVGHTDPIGSSKYNQRLSEQRANSVKSFLVSKGITSNKISTVGMGETNLECDNKKQTRSDSCSAQNRRVEITTDYQK